MIELTPEQRLALSFPLGPTAPELQHTFDLHQASLTCDYTIAVVWADAVFHHPMWMCRAQFMRKQFAQYAPGNGTGLHKICVALLNNVGRRNAGEWWRYDKARHFGQLLVPMTPDELAEVVDLDDRVWDDAVGTYTKTRTTKFTVNQN